MVLHWWLTFQPHSIKAGTNYTAWCVCAQAQYTNGWKWLPWTPGWQHYHQLSRLPDQNVDLLLYRFSIYVCLLQFVWCLHSYSAWSSALYHPTTSVWVALWQPYYSFFLPVSVEYFLHWNHEGRDPQSQLLFLNTFIQIHLIFLNLLQYFFIRNFISPFYLQQSTIAPLFKSIYSSS